jgi:CheY-like chemotaxis protein
VFWFDVPLLVVDGLQTDVKAEDVVSTMGLEGSAEVVAEAEAAVEEGSGLLTANMLGGSMRTRRDSSDTSRSGASWEGGGRRCFKSSATLTHTASFDTPTVKALTTTASFSDDLDEGSAGRVLVVDDSVMVQKLLVAALTRQNFEVETAKNGREALEKMTKGSEPYLVVLMDFLMPVLDGITATSMFRGWESTVLLQGGTGSGGEGGSSGATADEVASQTTTVSSSRGSASNVDVKRVFTSLESADSREPLPIVRLKRQTVIGISANAESADVEAAKRAGVDHFLSKPVKVAQIVEYIKALE